MCVDGRLTFIFVTVLVVSLGFVKPEFVFFFSVGFWRGSGGGPGTLCLLLFCVFALCFCFCFCF